MPDFFKIWEFFQVLPRYTLFQKIALFFGLPITIYFVYLLTVGRPPLVTLFLTLSDDYTAQRIPTNAGNLEGYLLRATVAVKNDAPSVAHTVRTIITDVLRVTGQNRLNCTAVLPKAIEVGGAGVDLPGGLSTEVLLGSYTQIGEFSSGFLLGRDASYSVSVNSDQSGAQHSTIRFDTPADLKEGRYILRLIISASDAPQASHWLVMELNENSIRLRLPDSRELRAAENAVLQKRKLVISKGS